MKFLLDTHAFLWARENPRQLSEAARKHLADTSHTIWVSAASMWEIAIKYGSGKLKLTMSLEEFYKTSPFDFLPLYPEDTLTVSTLPDVHKDPFDRMLVAQAMAHKLIIITRDPNIPRYGVAVMRA